MINVICTGRLKENYLKEAQDEYVKRISAFFRINIIEKKEAVVPKNPSEPQIEKASLQESSDLYSSIKGCVISLSPDGIKMTSKKFASIIQERFSKDDISFLIGGSFGLHADIKAKSDIVLSFSDMTMPHQLFRIVLLEQIYRSFMINNQRTYHK